MTKTKTIIKYGGIELSIVNSDNPSVPKEALSIDLPATDRKALAIAVKNNIPALLIGETGTGKTSAVKELAYLLKQAYTRISLTGYTTPDELIGSKSVKDGATYYENGILTKAMIEGHICVLDELNAITPDASFIIHSLLDDEHKVALPNGDIITPHPNFRVFATINPDYEGTKSLNRAFLDRFGILIFIQIMNAKAEAELLVTRYGIAQDVAERLVATAWLNRKAYSEGKTITLISTRGLLQVSNLIHEGMTPSEAYKTAIINKARTDENKAFLDFYNAIFKTSEEYQATMPRVLTPQEVKENMDNEKKLQRNIAELTSERDMLIRKINSYESGQVKIIPAKWLPAAKTYPLSSFWHGQKYTAELEGHPIEGKITIEDKRIYICQNYRAGSSCGDKQGYDKSWNISEGVGSFEDGHEYVTKLRLQAKPSKTKSKTKDETPIF